MIQNHQKRINIIIGKNGSGKSTYLRKIDQINQGKNDFRCKYITPERGGSLNYDPGIDNNMGNSANWLENSRRVNRFDQFRQQSAAQYRNLELLMLRTIEKDNAKRADLNYTFDKIVDKINGLLPIVRMVRSKNSFKVQNKKTGADSSVEVLSSGESELIALAIEILVFAYEESPLQKCLLIDEPDVHLHPDLQSKFGSFLESVAEEYGFKAIIATHSTAFISSFRNRQDVEITVMGEGAVVASKFSIDEISSMIVPIFGVHPLSQVFSQSKIMLVEGEDDKRVIEQMARTSQGRIAIYPCDVGGKGELPKWEAWVNNVCPSIYDSPVIYSLRDLDDSNISEIDDNGIVIRFKLNCRAIENAIYSDEVLTHCGFKPDDLKNRLESFIETYPRHKYVSDIQELVGQFENRRIIDIKNVRNIIVGLLDIEKPWEVLLGQVLGNMSATYDNGQPDSICTYLGQKFFDEIFPHLTKR